MEELYSTNLLISESKISLFLAKLIFFSSDIIHGTASVAFAAAIPHPGL